MACAGIDFGNKTSVVAIARRGGIDVCANEVSNRATPSIVSFQGDERHIGESAASMAAQNHLNTVASIQRLIGVPHGSPFEAIESCRVTCNLISHATTKSTAASVSYTGLESDDDSNTTIFSFEQLCAMLLSKLMDIACLENKAPVRDVVVSVPVYYTHSQRQAMMNAAAIANINVLRVMNEHSAIALSYGIFRTKELPDTIPIKVAFVDIGESSTTVMIASFTNTKCDVLSVCTDPHLGGRDLDDIIVNKFAKHFKTTYGIDVLSKPKPAARLRKEAEKIKKVLSANPESPLNIECLMNDVDVKGHITRDELEEIAQPVLERIKSTCRKVIDDAKLKDDEKLTAVELVGGSTRVPAFKNCVGEVFSEIGTVLRTTLNADECIARGCALMSAMLSPTFKVRDYVMTDIATHTLLADKVFGDGSPTETLKLVPKGNPVPCVKVMKFKSPGALTINVKYEDSSSLPATIGGDGQGSVCCGYLVDAPIDNEAKVHAKIRVTGSGILEMVSAQLVKEVEVEEEVVVKLAESTPVATGKSDAKTNGNGTPKDVPAGDVKEGGDGENVNENGVKEDIKMDTEDDKKNEEEKKEEEKKEEAPAPVVTEKRMVKKKKFTDLTITPLEVGGCGMTSELVMSSTEKEAKMKAHDNYIKERSEAMNSLEAYVYDLRSRIDEYGGDLKEFGSTEMRDKLRKELDEIEEWIYSEEAEKASKSIFVEKRKVLMKKAYGLLMRKKEFDERPVRMRVLEGAMDKYKEVVVGGSEEYAHLKDEDKEKVLKCVESAAVWLKKERSQQDVAAKDVDPSLTCEMLSAKLKEVEGVCEAVKNTPKPAPPAPAAKEEEEKVEDSADKMDTTEDGTATAGKGKGKEEEVAGEAGAGAEAEAGTEAGVEESGKGELAGDGIANGQGEGKEKEDEMKE